MRIIALLATLLVLLAVPVMAQERVNVVLTNSDPMVPVHANFRGQTVTLFGVIEPVDATLSGPFSVVVLVQGPSSDWVVREKRRNLGFVLNSGSAHYDRVPSQYAILSTAPLATIADKDVMEQGRFSFEGLAAAARSEDAPGPYDTEFIRLMAQAGRFVEGERAVTMLSPSAFAVRVPLASDAVNGLYQARAIILAEGQIVGESTTQFFVRTLGFERFIADTARQNPALYGLASVLLALLTGWVGGMLFRR